MEHLTICFNLAVLAATQLTRHNFTGLGTVAGVPVGCGPEAGLVAIETGDSDPGGAPIAARFELAGTDLGDRSPKQIARVIAGLETTGTMEALVRYDKGDWQAYPLTPGYTDLSHGRQSAPCSRRHKGRYFQVGLRNVAGCDFSLDRLRVVAAPASGRRGVT